MIAQVCQAARTGSAPRWRVIGASLAAAAMLASLAACSSATTSPSASGPVGSGAAPVTTSAPTATPAAFADTLRVGGIDVDSGFASQFWWFRQGSIWQHSPHWTSNLITLGGLVYSSLYRWDSRYDPLPDLADGPCLPQADPKVIRCRLIETSFQDGTPLTADDVVYTYQIWLRPSFALADAATTRSLITARVVDPRTVDFALASVDPTFLTEALPAIPVLSRHAIEAAYTDFVARTHDLHAADLTKLADAIDEETGREPPLCAPRTQQVSVLVAQIGFPLYREDFSHNTGTFDECGYVRTGGSIVRQAAVAMGLTGLDAVAASYQLLSTSWRPIGTGPYRFVSEDADRVHLEAWPGYHGGLAATRYVDFVPTRPDGSDLIAGTVDVYQSPFLGADYQASAAARGVVVATPPQGGHYDLMFNVRPGRIFADRALRKALQLCIDVPRVVDAATGGGGTLIYGPVTPWTWAFDPSIPKPARDASAARMLIEAAGWRAGADGVYEKDGQRLAAQIPVRADDPERVRAADLIADNARDCGIELRTAPMDWDRLRAIFTYPNTLPGTDQPFDLYVGLWFTGTAEPEELLPFRTSVIADAKHPDGINFTGFSDPAFDALVEQALATYDQAERARLYRQAQQELAAQVPYVFLWAADAYDVIRAAVTTVDGPLDLSMANWCWQPERMVVAASGN